MDPKVVDVLSKFYDQQELQSNYFKQKIDDIEAKLQRIGEANRINTDYLSSDYKSLKLIRRSINRLNQIVYKPKTKSIVEETNLEETDDRLKPENDNTFNFSARYVDNNSITIEDNGLFVIQQFNQADL